LSPGREGAEWLMREAGRLKMTTSINPSISGQGGGNRMPWMAELSGALYEAKLEFNFPAFLTTVSALLHVPGR